MSPAYAYRLDVTWPDDWHESGIPDAVQDALDMLPDPFRKVFTNRRVAYGRQRFWKSAGAAAEVVRSNPVTWPDGRSA